MKKIKEINLFKFFDYFGLPVFIFLMTDSIFYLLAGDDSWRVIIRLLIGVAGVLVDGYLVFFHKDK
ncbi:MAG: hypothetical protein KAT32_00970 [Candidatus Moranbacteria bacterium]|nr:hypothetical protein [Candidatus Moranbacteria bacterium]